MVKAPHIEVLVFEGCPHAESALEMTRRVVDRLCSGAQVEKIEVDTEEKAAALGFLGSPSIRVDGRDVEGKTTTLGALCCRTYEGGSGVPPEWMVEAAVLRALKPSGILFLCVANSARSQMAEGMARSIAPEGVKVWSAGSRPAAQVRPEAVVVMREIGIDIAHQKSKAINEIPTTEVDAVITLCAEEECPVFPGKVARVHWSLPDPAAVSGSEEERLNAFRATRDELSRRLALLLA